MVLVGLGLMMVAMPSESERELAKRGISEGEGAVAAWGFFGLCCPIGTWLLIALPLGFAAIATLESRKPAT